MISRGAGLHINIIELNKQQKDQFSLKLQELYPTWNPATKPSHVLLNCFSPVWRFAALWPTWWLKLSVWEDEIKLHCRPPMVILMASRQDWMRWQMSCCIFSVNFDVAISAAVRSTACLLFGCHTSLLRHLNRVYSLFNWIKSTFHVCKTIYIWHKWRQS